MRIQLRQLVGERCITQDQGKVLFSKIQPALVSGESVTIDFAGVKVLLSLFLNNSIGPLFHDFDGQQLDALLKFENLSSSQRETLDHVLENAEAYYRDPATRKAVDDTLTKMLEEMEAKMLEDLE